MNYVQSNQFHFMVFDRWGELIYETNDVNAAWPGLSMNNNPGTVSFNFKVSRSLPHVFFIVSKGILLQPMCCVILPASVSAVELCLI